MRLSSAQIKFCQIPYANFEMRSWLLSKFWIPLQFHERLLLCTFLAKTIYTLLIRSPLKWKSLRLLSAPVKICQIPYANFETTSRFLSKFGIPLQFHERLFLCTFLAQTIYTLLKFLMPILKQGVNSFQILRPSSVSWKITPLCFFSSNIIYFAH